MGNKSLSGQISSRLTIYFYPWKYPGISWGFRVELISNQMLNELPKMNKPLDVKLRTRAFCSLELFSPTAPTKKKKKFFQHLSLVFSPSLPWWLQYLEVFISLVFQFEDVSLNTCLWLLERGQLGTAARANPVRVTRCISAMVRVSQLMGWLLPEIPRKSSLCIFEKVMNFIGPNL